MKFDILSATKEEIEEEINRGYFRKIFLHKKSNIPEEAKDVFWYIKENIKKSKYFRKDYSIAYIEDNMPLMGMVWRLYIYKKTDTETNFNIKELIAHNQVVSIYYDNNDVLGITGVPYFEIYDGYDVDRFFANEYEDLLEKVESILINEQIGGNKYDQ